MLRLLASTLAALAVSTTTVVADPAAPRPSPGAPGAPEAPEAPKTHVAIAVNPPLGWVGGNFGISGYLALTDRHVLRANVARYAYTPNFLGEVIGVAAGGDGSEGSYSGHITDAGLSWMLFPDALWDGFTIELGALYRGRGHRVLDDFAAVDILETDTHTVSARGLLGWSWLLRGRVFISLQAGGSVGRELGTETADNEFDDRMAVTTSISRTQVSVEGFMRIGVPFDL